VRWVTVAGDRLYCSVTEADLEREAKVLALLRERFADWQERGFIPSKAMPRVGIKTEEPIRTRGWTHWHHLFHPRQLLVNGLLSYEASKNKKKFPC
jgi:adenine-specific DNA methylase